MSTYDSDPESLTEVLDAEVWRQWSSGPRWYYALAALIPDQDVKQRQLQVARALSDWLILDSDSQPHVTVRTLGFTPVQWRTRDVDLIVGQPETFVSAAYLKVMCPDILQLRGLLETTNFDSQPLPSEDRNEAYVPHITVGTYRRVVPLAKVRARLSCVSAVPDLRVTATIHQIAIDTRSRVGKWHKV